MRLIPILPFHYYHIYNRGVDKGPIFFSTENYKFFIDRMGKYFNIDTVQIVAYCLMPNHFHLLVYPFTDNFGNQVMQPFSVSYTKAINKQQMRSGSLFQGPYQARHIGRDRYLLHLSRYIHLNPVSAGLVSRPEDWEFSSYRDYIGLREDEMVKTDIILHQFRNSADYIEFVISDIDSRLPSSLLIDE